MLIGEASKLQQPRKSFLKLTRQPYKDVNIKSNEKKLGGVRALKYETKMSKNPDILNGFDETLVPGSIDWEEI